MAKEITLTVQHKTLSKKMATKWANHSRQEKRQGCEEHLNNELIDKKRTKDNITIIDNLKGFEKGSMLELIDNEYQDVLDELNANKKDKRPSRMVTRYSDKIGNKRQPEPFHEFVIEIGNSKDLTKDGLPYYGDNFENLDVGGEEWERRKASLIDYVTKDFKIDLPTFKTAYAGLHLDESNPHVHIGGFFKTPNSQEGKKRTVESYTPGFNQALFYSIEKNGLKDDVKLNKKGDPLASDAYTLIIDKKMKGNVLKHYNNHSSEPFKRKEARKERKALTMQEYKEITNPINELTVKLLEQYNKFKLYMDILENKAKELGVDLEFEAAGINMTDEEMQEIINSALDSLDYNKDKIELDGKLLATNDDNDELDDIDSDALINDILNDFSKNEGLQL